ncbi:UvrD-helicase domain-containing protein [Acinetobacter dispersus]|uniref:UvrD-helicase domain-containing protein n=1 Tax=Acinetobacter dispersus TaxID=70348 RepID=UPI0021CDAEA5|nr:UvrD-helicase domain-containing protein [Acinetobacter dispersus]MCU4337990.1 UvrD-helicase domain-containing protein [Acinetobacter dispersus]
MDAIEIARQRADKLHHEAVKRGLDPWNSYAFAVGEAVFREITVEKCLQGSDELNGGRAFFDSVYRLITHENSGSLFEQAFLVAHEIGHVELGDDTQDEYVINIDPARTTETELSGISSIVDYNHRQRREVQMDLFAREFLIPRSVVKKLHLECQMTCSDIASKLGAPFDVVAQQMLDAMLLPMVEHKPPIMDLEKPLNQKQNDAVNHRGPAFLLQAGPGTGKTRTLIARVESLLNEEVDPQRILLLTFSNKAAAEISERIARKQPHEAAALWIGTFHGFGLDLLRRFHDLCDLPAELRLMDRTEAVELLEDAFLRLNLIHYRNLYDPSQNIVDILNAISRAKDEVIDALEYRVLAENMLAKAISAEERETAERALEVATVYDVYEKIKKQANCLDFGDLVMLPVQLLEANEELRKQLQHDYLHVLVDEYQDVNRSSIRLLKALKPYGDNLWVVGDAKQSIYRFRGASSFNISRFCVEDFPGSVAQSLQINYRSTSEIVNAFSCFALDMKTGGRNSALTANRPTSGYLPEIRIAESGDMISCTLAESIKKMHDLGFKYRDQAVLCRGNDKLSELGQDLERLGVPVLFLGSLFERPEIKDLIALVSLLTDKRASGLIRIACCSEFKMSMEDVIKILEHLRTNEKNIWDDDISLLDLSSEGLFSFEKLKTVLQGFNNHSHPWNVLATVLLDRTRMLAEIATSATVGDKAGCVAIWKFMNFARQQIKGNSFPVLKMMMRMRRLIKLNDDRDLSQLPTAVQNIDAVRLMTIHGSKGLEFPVVHLSGVNQDTLPGSYRQSKCPPPEGMVAGSNSSSNDIAKEAHDNEQECLFYVAMSRAQDRLFFYGARSKGIKKTKRPLSNFLGRLGPVHRIETLPILQLPISQENIPLLVEFQGDVNFSSNALDLYDRCPRRFLYTHILSIGGRRQETAFMQMHEAVREVFQALIGLDPSTNWKPMLEASFEKFGLHNHGYINDYRKIAEMMLNYFTRSRDGAILEVSDKLILNVADVKVTIHVDEILLRDGARKLRCILTGHAPNSDPKSIKHAAFFLAAKRTFPNSSAELVFLADNKVHPLEFKLNALSNCEDKLIKISSRIRNGDFKIADSAFNCPSCPALFICGKVPTGTIKKKF